MFYVIYWMDTGGFQFFIISSQFSYRFRLFFVRLISQIQLQEELISVYTDHRYQNYSCLFASRATKSPAKEPAYSNVASPEKVLSVLLEAL